MEIIFIITISLLIKLYTLNFIQVIFVKFYNEFWFQENQRVRYTLPYVDPSISVKCWHCPNSNHASIYTCYANVPY